MNDILIAAHWAAGAVIVACVVCGVTLTTAWWSLALNREECEDE
jgi:hypothetical protein